MKRKYYFLALSLALSCNFTFMHAQVVPIAKSVLVGDRIVEFIPKGFDQTKTPSLMLKEEPTEKGDAPSNWVLTPEFSMTMGKASASLQVPTGTSLYGTGEVTGPLLRNGQTIKIWNTDTPGYKVDNGKRLYQTHPWVLGVRPDGTAFGVLFDTTWKAELTTNSDEIQIRTEGALFRTFVIDRESPQAVLKALAELSGTIVMPPRWALGYHQCRWSYESEARVKQVADTFRLKKIPCDVIWMDIDYMEGFRVFTFNKKNFPNPKGLMDYLHNKDFHAVCMIDPGVKVDSDYSVYKSGKEKDLFVKDAYRNDYNGKVWPGECVFPDFTRPDTRRWWAGLYKDYMATGIDGVWNDMNDPSVFDVPTLTMPENNVHLGGGNLPIGSHLLYHNAYGRLMVEASRDGIVAANPDKRPFVLTRSNTLGGQRYAATWTGDNTATVEHMKMSVPMSINFGLSGQAFNGPDIGGFMDNTTPDLWANWLSFGVFMPFARGHASKFTNNKEPWAFGEKVEESSRIAIERRYRLLPYLYTLFHESSLDGMPVMQPVFFADTKDLNLRSEDQVFLLGSDLLVIPPFAKKPALPKGIWENMSLVKGDHGAYQAQLKIRGGSIIPVGKIVQSTQENSLDPLTLIVCLDENGNASGSMYWDSGNGWAYLKGEFINPTFNAKRNANKVDVSIDHGTKTNYNIDFKQVSVELIYKGKVYQATGNLEKGITVKI